MVASALPHLSRGRWKGTLVVGARNRLRLVQSR
jgi:hypothetical protein